MASTSTDIRPRGLATALRGIEQDSRMRDAPGVSKHFGGGKLKAFQKTSKKAGHRQRTVDPFKAESSSRMLVDRIASKLSNPLAVRGAAVKPQSSLRPRKVVTSGGVPVSNRVNVLQVWREFVQARYNPEARFLNLERIADDENLKKNGVHAPGTKYSNKKEFPVIFKLASQLNPPVETISLASNKLSNGQLLATLPHYLPKLSNLSIQDNLFTAWKDIDYIVGKKEKEKLTSLREIVVIGNPLRENEIQKGRAENFRRDMSRRFPSLEVLDQEAITKIAFDVPVASSSSTVPSTPSATSFPLPMASSFVTGVDGSVISNFLTRFFSLFDTERPALTNVYAPNATFSYSAYSTVPPRARLQRLHYSKEFPNQRNLEWAPWIFNQGGGSRNLSRIDFKRVVNSLHTGPEAIISAVSAAPRTKHDVLGAAEKFCIDAWPAGQGANMLLFVCVHGEFTEVVSQGIRSFDRTFILAPAPAGSNAATNGWDVVILSDQLTIRGYSSHEAWKPGPMHVQQNEPPSRQYQSQQQQQHQGQPVSIANTTSVPIPEAIRTAVQTIPEPQRNMVVTVCGRTGLNVKFSMDCLTQNDWDIEKAVANFEQVKANLGREAFI